MLNFYPVSGDIIFQVREPLYVYPQYTKILSVPRAIRVLLAEPSGFYKLQYLDDGYVFYYGSIHDCVCFSSRQISLFDIDPLPVGTED